MTVIPSAQRRPEPKLRRHGDHSVAVRVRVNRSTKAGAETPATRGPRPRPGSRGCPLNEGRSRNSGDTLSGSPRVAMVGNAQRRPEPKLRRHKTSFVVVTTIVVAQRRPEPKLRRHGDQVLQRVADPQRSTKAGAETPATPEYTRGFEMAAIGAQRRPEPKLRRHGGNRCSCTTKDRARSTKAGAETPATPERDERSRHILTRSTKAGAETPATQTHHIEPTAYRQNAQRRPEPKLRRHTRQARFSASR